MREILFRGKRIDNGEWVEGYYVRLYGSNGRVSRRIYTSCAEVDCGDYYPDFFEVQPSSVSQYTGRKDKNGKYIFEGDILHFSYTGENRGVEGTEAVVFKNGKFGVEWGWHKELVCLDGFANTEFEVIGNIYDNPELVGCGE